MKKTMPPTMFSETEQARFGALRNWVLEHQVTEIVMTERQFWVLAQLQPVAEKPWTTFMGRPLRVPAMAESVQKCLGIFDQNPAAASAA